MYDDIVIVNPDKEQILTKYDTFEEVHNYLELDEALEAGRIALFRSATEAFIKAEELNIEEYKIMILEDL